MILAAAIEKPSPTNDLLPWAVLALFVLVGAALLGVAWLGGQVLSLKNRVDVMDDAATPSFTEKFAERRPLTAPRPVYPAEPLEPDPDEVRAKPTPYPRTDTAESDVARQVENAKLEAERQPTYREFTTSDGTVHRFEVKQ